MVSQKIGREQSDLKLRRFSAAMLMFFLLLRLLPGFAGSWAAHISKPALHLLENLGNRAPFPLLEWIAAGMGLLLLAGIFSKAVRTAGKALALTLIFACLVLWYPLYSLEAPVYHASEAQLYASCVQLIEALNGQAGEFLLPEDLPARAASPSGWMRLLNLGGFCSFCTGEALYSPDLPPEAIPFVAVHERMHLKGYADEGQTNIAAWEDCMKRGAAYAFSARLWALRYSMGLMSLQQRRSLTEHMSESTLALYRSCGRAAIPASSPFMGALQRFAGIGNQMQNYENLALYLAAEFPQ